MATRLLIANLDCEAEFARAAGCGAGSLSDAALRTASVLGTLLRIFASEGDLLWTPRPVDPELLGSVAGIAVPRLVSGPRDALGWTGPVLAWSGTDPVCAQVNHRMFRLGVAGLPPALPGTRTIRSREELVAHLEAGGAKAAAGRYVLKAPWSAAGRERLFATAPEVPGRLDVFLARYREVLCEPYVERTADFGCAARVRGEGSEVVSVHRLEVDGRGRFRGIASGPVPDEVREALAERAEAVGRSLAAEGYRGPFGIDGFSWRAPGGGIALHAPCEINARLTFGHVFAALREREPEETLTLRFGSGPPDGARILLRAGPSPTPAAWLESS